MGRGHRRADLLVRVRDEHAARASGTPPRSSRSAAIAYRPGEQPALHVGDAGPGRDPALVDRERARRRGPRRRTPCPCGRCTGAWGPPGRSPASSPMTVSPEALVVGVHGHRERRGPRSRSAVQRPTSSTPALVYAAAVDVDEALEVVEEGGLGRARRRRGWPRAPRRARGRRRCWSCPKATGTTATVPHRRAAESPSTGSVRRAHGALAYPRRTVRLVEIRLLRGPNVYRLMPVVKVEVAVGRTRAWHGSRVACGRRARPPRADGPGPRLAGRRGRPRRVDAPAARRPRRARRARAQVHRASDTGRWVVTWPWAGAERARLIAEAAVDLAAAPCPRPPGPAHRHPGALGRGPLGGADQPRPRDAARLDPRRGAADARRLDHRHQRQVDGDPAHHPHPASGPGRRVGTTTSDGILVDERMIESGDWTGPGGAAVDPAPDRRGRRGARDRARRPRAAGHGLRVQRRVACSPTSRRTTSTSRGSTRSPSSPRSRRRSAG